mmetsp:Transcript_4389/g.9747  ORF Transcript_4389/g.9747 Transcript_4389/m.9747 type:complete len:137 (+) Transcript_4389:88-498(+)
MDSKGESPRQPRQFRLSSTGDVVNSEEADNNPVLMEARLTEMIVSLQQLIRTNEQLEEALCETMDEDLLQALKENDELILRRRRAAAVLAAKLHERSGVDISLSDKVPPYAGSSVLKRIEDTRREKGEGRDGGMYL